MVLFQKKNGVKTHRKTSLGKQLLKQSNTDNNLKQQRANYHYLCRKKLEIPK